MWTGFKGFIMRGSIIEVAVAFVVALAFSTLVQAFVTTIIKPLIAAAGGAKHLGLGWLLRTGNPSTFVDLGGFISAIIYFVIFMAVVYFLIVTPYKVFQERRGRTAFADPPPVKTCVACLSADLPLGATKCKYCGTEQPAAGRAPAVTG
ncbi:MAG: MscL family protein [Acidimicrobiales bacterium]